QASHSALTNGSFSDISHLQLGKVRRLVLDGLAGRGAVMWAEVRSGGRSTSYRRYRGGAMLHAPRGGSMRTALFAALLLAACGGIDPSAAPSSSSSQDQSSASGANGKGES